MELTTLDDFALHPEEFANAVRYIGYRDLPDRIVPVALKLACQYFMGLITSQELDEFIQDENNRHV